jgi:hypothetical protein
VVRLYLVDADAAVASALREAFAILVAFWDAGSLGDEGGA